MNFSVFFIFSMCKPVDTTSERSKSSYIIDNNDIKPLSSSSLTESLNLESAFASAVLITTKSGPATAKFCSGTLVVVDMSTGALGILTNHHCFAEVDTKGNVQKTLLSGACTETNVYFGFSELNDFDYTKIACKPGTLRTDPLGDLAVFQLLSSPPESYKPLSLWEYDVPPIKRPAFIVHYPNIKENLRAPKGEKIPLPTTSITYDNCLTDGPYDKKLWSLDPVLPYSFRHTCDLIHGSSGSALIDVKTSKILGVNWGGMKIDLSDENLVDNVSTKPGYVRHFLYGTGEYINPSNSDTARGIGSASAISTASADSLKGNADKGKKSKKAGNGCGVIFENLATKNLATYHLMLLFFLLVPLALICVKSFYNFNFCSSNKKR
ncbi:MAG: serine protease [Bdellovibrionota bacterium]